MEISKEVINADEQIYFLQARMQYLELSAEQAKKILSYEQSLNLYPSVSKIYLTDFEEREYEFHVFKEILNKKQFDVYQKHFIEVMKNYTDRISEYDASDRNAKQIEYNTEQLQYYKSQFLPDFFKRLPASLVEIRRETTEVQQLKEKFRHWLKAKKIEKISLHFRHHRSYSPNRLRLQLIETEVENLIPAYDYFKSEQDRDTLTLAETVEKQKLNYIDKDLIDFFKMKFNDKFFFMNQLNKQFFPDVDFNVNEEINVSENELMLIRTMAVVLMLEGGYSD
jgi:hypothetical protein